jgi:hypothetical protein
VCDLETSRMGAPYICDIGSLRVNDLMAGTVLWQCELGSFHVMCPKSGLQHFQFCDIL